MPQCSHGGAIAGRACTHLASRNDSDYLQRFTGRGLACELVCPACAKGDAGEILTVCSDCLQKIETAGCWDGIVGRPETRVRTADAGRFVHDQFTLHELRGVELLAIVGVEGRPGVWIAVAASGSVLAIDATNRIVHRAAQLTPAELAFDGPEISRNKRAWPKGPHLTARVSRSGSILAVANTYGERGAVIDLETGQVRMHLRRDAYHEDVSAFSLAFTESRGRPLLIHASRWNRLDVSDPLTGKLLTPREIETRTAANPTPAHDLDYFHGNIYVSPDGAHVADTGWVWHPCGVTTTWSLADWLAQNPWESEDGPSRRPLQWVAYFWDGPACWIGQHLFAIWGYGRDDEWLIPAVQIFDARTGARASWFSGPHGQLAFKERLFSFDRAAGTAVWDVDTGERLGLDEHWCPDSFHPGTGEFLTVSTEGRISVTRWMEDPPPR